VLRRLSLRARLILGVISLAAVGLVVADVVTYSSLHSFLIDRTDASLDDAHIAVEGALFGPGGPPRDEESTENPPVNPLRPGIGPLTAAARGDYVELRLLNGRTVVKGLTPQFSGGKSPPAPRLPASIKVPAFSTRGERPRYFTVPAVSGDGRYRVRASIEPHAGNYILIVAAPLSGVDSTLHRLFLIELLVTASVLAAIALLGLWVVRLGLRPLAAIGATAAKIAAGDLSQRVERADRETEVGRLGLALNVMLGQIETAFRAQEASERKLRRFVADASHELRTPLAAVRAYAELFTRGAAEHPDDLERSMTGISRESERMSVLVEDLLLLAHLDEGLPLELSPVALDEVVAEAVETARMVDPERPLEAKLEPVTILGDRDRLRQIVDNLLANARSHTPAGTPVHVTVGRLDGTAQVVVADDGPGIDHEQVPHLFERFYRADPSRARASGGVGLGLSIVAAVAEAHGGRVSAESEPGKGSTFRIELPLASED
jgi:two-component system OmpR family sensor kinase